MKIFIAGASGAIGSHLVTQLVARGHEVVGTTRSAAKTGALRALGAEPVIVDALDPDSVADAVAKAEPEVVVHQLTALSGPADFRHHVAQRGDSLLGIRGRVRLDPAVFVSDRPAGALHPHRVALRHEPAHPDDTRSGQQVVSTDGAQPVGSGRHPLGIS
ncbi:NAD dependent epimerase/dehydratase family protein [Micromonospora rhizosphaerae]|uniref:NAD dependent epimerase/dehydratase family protein n=1 Tax=Micromonospora rhizosphaerae TaxID=568872 RepID=A0A1C6RRX7_9ACTN|nr:NAD-dependent epimerase/dehydratase family protein [Micromonospora rhizosphaerae]SCL19955.1 NAD dependent epimerase/dehydratase family protein [Micromonospora rhizosphaerae]